MQASKDQLLDRLGRICKGIDNVHEQPGKFLHSKLLCGVQILTHMREKLQFVMRSNKMLRKEVHALGGDLATKRDALAKVKAHRDKLRVGARSIKEGSLYIDNPMLLEDMKKQVLLPPLEWMVPV